MKKTIFILSILIVVLIGCSESENDNIINNNEEINEKKPIYFDDINPVEFLGVWELRIDTARSPQIRDNDGKFLVSWSNQLTPQMLEFKTDTNHFWNTTLTITPNDTPLKKWWRYTNISDSKYFKIEYSPYENTNTSGGMNYSENWLGIISYDDKKLIIEISSGASRIGGTYKRLEYEKVVSYSVDEDIFDIRQWWGDDPWNNWSSN